MYTCHKHCQPGFSLRPRSTHLQEILSVVPGEIGRKVLSLHVHTVVSAEPLLITVENDLVLAGRINADSVVDE